MWLHLVARDEANQVVFESGHYDGTTGVLTHDARLRHYGIELGISHPLALALGAAHGPSFHFTLNDSVYVDTRIPPQGFTNAAFDAFGGAPVDPAWAGPGPRYADGQHWDVASYMLPPSARTAVATLYYQTTSKDYVEFLRDENTTNAKGQEFHDLWVANGRAAPVAMASDEAAFLPVGVPAGLGPGAVELAVLRNPFRDALEMVLELERATRVTIEVLDPLGRRLWREDRGALPAGTHRLEWNARDARGRALGAGTYWVRVVAGDVTLVRSVVRLR
jgi:hypothetical protein